MTLHLLAREGYKSEFSAPELVTESRENAVEVDETPCEEAEELRSRELDPL